MNQPQIYKALQVFLTLTGMRGEIEPGLWTDADQAAWESFVQNKTNLPFVEHRFVPASEAAIPSEVTSFDKWEDIKQYVLSEEAEVSQEETKPVVEEKSTGVEVKSIDPNLTRLEPKGDIEPIHPTAADVHDESDLEDIDVSDERDDD